MSLLLASSTEKLQIITGSTASTDYSISFSDTPGGVYEQGQTSDGSISTATTTDVVAAPQPRVVRNIISVRIRNTHASTTQTVTLQKNNNGTAYKVTPSVTLFPGESLWLSTVDGLEVYAANGALKTKGVSYAPPQAMTNPNFQTNDITSTIQVGPGWSVASYMGKAPRNLDWATVRLRVTTAASVGPGEWCQVALAKGDVNVGGNPTLTVVGFTSAEGVLNSTGLKSVVVSVGANSAINEGDNLWAVVGCSTGTGGTSPRFRAGLADDVQAGTFALVSNQPSAIINTATAGVILGATVSAPWFVLVT